MKSVYHLRNQHTGAIAFALLALLTPTQGHAVLIRADYDPTFVKEGSTGYDDAVLNYQRYLNLAAQERFKE
jgi:hypothetical protein